MNNVEKDMVKEKLSRIMWLSKILEDEKEHSSIISFASDSWKSITVYKLESFNKVTEAYEIEASDITTEVVCDGHIKKSTVVNGFEINVYILKGSNEYECIKRSLDL